MSVKMSSTDIHHNPRKDDLSIRNYFNMMKNVIQKYSTALSKFSVKCLYLNFYQRISIKVFDSLE